MSRPTAPHAAVTVPAELAASDEPVLPNYGGACLSEIVPTLLRLGELAAADELPAWLPEPLRTTEQVVLLVLDGLGALQLAERSALAPQMAAMDESRLTSVCPTTTATALTSIVTGSPPASHGILGYRLRVNDEVLNVLRWTTPSGDARSTVRPHAFQTVPAFLGRRVPIVTRTEFAGSGFTEAHLAGAELRGWRQPSSLAVIVGDLLKDGARFVYAYYDGVDAVAHETGLGARYDAELVAADRIVGDIAARLPSGAALAVTSDHGQVEVRAPLVELDEDLLKDVVGLSGEGRFRWLHARPGTTARLAATATERYGDIAWVRTLEELEASGAFGGPLPPAFRQRLGDVALLAKEAISFADPADPADSRLVSRHGSLTAAEAYVPLLAVRR